VSVLWVGTDVVDLDRFRLALRRTPGMVERVFTEGERSYALRKRDPTERLAARFAVKEATTKARTGEPSLVLVGRAAELAERRGITAWKVSITHSDLIALAVVIAQ
jgi:holo-[acyl-carrier protein] synthase